MGRETGFSNVYYRIPMETYLRNGGTGNLWDTRKDDSGTSFFKVTLLEPFQVIPWPK